MSVSVPKTSPEILADKAKDTAKGFIHLNQMIATPLPLVLDQQASYIFH